MIKLNETVIQAFDETLLAAFLGSTLLILLASFATWFLRTSSASIRYSIWQTTIAASLCLPIAALLLPNIPLASFPLTHPNETHTAEVEPLTSIDVNNRTTSSPNLESNHEALPTLEPTPPLSDSLARRQTESQSAPATPPASLPLEPLIAKPTVNEPKSSFAPSMRLVLLVTWSSVAALLLMRLLWGCVKVRELTYQSILLDNDEIATRTGIKPTELQRTKLSVSNELTVPFTTGVFSPHILLTQDSLKLAPAELQMVIRHELAHIQRRDVFWQLINSITTALYWFQPLVWIASQLSKREREQACDDLVLDEGSIPDSYAAVLLNFAAKCSGKKQMAANAVAMGQPPLERRLKAILNESTCRRKVGVGQRSIVAFAAAIFVIGISIAQPSAAEKPAVLEEQVTRTQQESNAPNQSIPKVLTGTVVDEEGNPLAGAKVELNYSVWKEHESTLERVTTHQQTFELITDDLGVYSLDTSRLGESLTQDDFAQANFYAWASQEGRVEVFDSRSGDFVVKDGKLRTIELPVGRKISGRVVAPSDSPRSAEVLNPIVRVVGPNFWRSRPALCDSDGSFSLRVPASGTIELLAVAENFAATRAFANKDEDVGDIELQHGTRVSGQVLDQSGNPVPGVVVTLRNDRFNEISKMHLNGSLMPKSSVKTEMGGRFEFPPFLGPCTVAVETQGRSQYSKTIFIDIFADHQPPIIMPQSIDLDGSDEHLEVTLQAGPTVEVSGTVRWPDGTPVVGTTVQSSISAGGQGVRLQKVKTNEAGEYRLTFPKDSEHSSVSCSGERDENALWHFAQPTNYLEANQKPNQILSLKKLTGNLTKADWKLVAKEERRPTAKLKSERAMKADIALKEISDRYYRDSAAGSVDTTTLVDELLRLEEAYRGESAALNALQKVLAHTSYLLDEEFIRTSTNAFDLLETHYLTHPELDGVMESLPSNFQLERTLRFLELAEEESPHPQVRASALLVQANLMARRLRWWDDLALNDWHVDGMDEDPATQELVAQLKAMNPDSMRQQAIVKATKLKAEYGNNQRQIFARNLQSFRMNRYTPVSAERFGTLADRVLFQMTMLRPGQIVADFEGTDVNGKPFKLSDFRGKVVMVMFSANWCGPCKAMYPECRELAATFKERPFQLISVMGDDEEQTIAEAHEAGDITWLTTWDGRRGPTVSKWNITSWPTVFIIDHNGVIRSTGSNERDRKELIEELIQQAEQ